MVTPLKKLFPALTKKKSQLIHMHKIRGEGDEQNATMSLQFCTQLIPCSVNLQYFLRPLH